MSRPVADNGTGGRAITEGGPRHQESRDELKLLARAQDPLPAGGPAARDGDREP
jgi:hypothetical protein